MEELTQAISQEAPSTPEQTNPEQSAPETPVTPEPKKESVSAAMLAAAKERKKALTLNKTLQSATKEIAELKAKIAEIEGKTATRKPSNALEALELNGFKYQDAVEQIMNNNNMTAEQKIQMLEKKLDERFKAVEEKEKTLEERKIEEAKAREQQELETFRTSVEDFLTENTESFELCNIRFDEAKQYIEDVIKADIQNQTKLFNEDPEEFTKVYKSRAPRLKSIKEAAELVEKYYEEDELGKILSAKKVQARLKPKEDPKPEDGAKPAPGKTLASAVTTSSAPLTNHAKSEADRIARALKALEGA